MTCHVPATVTLVVDECKPRPFGGGHTRHQPGNLSLVPTAPIPPLEFLTCAYLGAMFLERSEQGESYEQQAAKLNTTKQTLMNLARGKTIGLRVLYHLAAEMFAGSIDAMNAEAVRWWTKLDDSSRERIRAWAAENEERRPTTSAKSDISVSRGRQVPVAKPAEIEAPSRPQHEKQGRADRDRARRHDDKRR